MLVNTLRTLTSIALLSIFVVGCNASHKPIRKVIHGEIVVARDCMTAIELTDKSECRYKEGDAVMKCTGLKLTKLIKCDYVEVQVKK